jgi:predicted glycosyltransferase
MYSLLLIVMGVPTVLDTFDLPQQCNYVMIEKIAADPEGQYACQRSDGKDEALDDSKVSIKTARYNSFPVIRYEFRITQ